MIDKNVYVGNQKVVLDDEPVSGNYVNINGESFYKISNYDNMNPFFMSIVSNSDHWMFISSNGGLSAGRKNPDYALFPYYTDDIIHTSHETTGSKSILQVTIEDKTYIWEPFSDYQKSVYAVKRNIYKNIFGNKIIFEEENHDLGLRFSYTWLSSEQYGFVKRAEIINFSIEDVKISLLDGIQNILPYGINQQFQNDFSTLVDGYKKNELLHEYGIGIYSMSSIPSDKAEPNESLFATSVWSTGATVEKYLLSSQQLNKFRLGKEITTETDIKALRGSYFLNLNFSLEPEKNKDWLIISEINQNLSKVANLKKLISESRNVKDVIENDINEGTEKLIEIVASADGLQLTDDKLVVGRHFSNVLFNTMRGGIIDDSYTIDKADFISFLKATNKKIFNKHEAFINQLDEKIHYQNLKLELEALNDKELIKISLEYLPLTFSRRHGDPSRPWNRFSINIKNSRGEKILNYEGNWRDLFQNWEALAISYPGYLEGMITKFLNATTADGYNPYRVTRDGFDWEVPEPDKPWSSIGYWGDHQIIYLLKLLELSVKFNPEELKSRVSENIYTYANVPYKVKSYSDLLDDPYNTIDFDHELHNEIIEQEQILGSDARFLTGLHGSLLQVNLAEKLLIPLLSKLSNFIPDAGIWMNTQRPEWNDANNALVGNGVSMVTLFYIRRYLTFCSDLFSTLDVQSISFSEEVCSLLEELNIVFINYKHLAASKITDEDRKIILDGLGIAGEKYRNKIYNCFSSKKKDVSIETILELFDTAKVYVDQTIKTNKRDDGLFHSYNLVAFSEDVIEVANLYEMLEGQVAVLSSGYLSIIDSVQLLDTLANSSLYREDQNSYILYPERQLSLFIDKNNIPAEGYLSSKFLKKLVEVGNDEIIVKDINGECHFNGEIRNANILKRKLKEITNKDCLEIVEYESVKVLEIYESIFNHKSFTGRSGTFYKYEGLGSIYWHMVSKLVLAVQETYIRGIEENADKSDLEKLKLHYYKIKDGIGLHKSPELYGAFPTDPYSHTPCFSGVQQPGMTGQVKEDILSRFGELGLQVIKGKISINPLLLNKNEFLSENTLFRYINTNGEKKQITIERGSLVYTYCQVPFIYTLSDSNSIVVTLINGKIKKEEGFILDKNLSSSIFKRKDEIEKVEVSIKN